MSDILAEERRLHHVIGFTGLRAQATSVAVLQLCTELRSAGVLGDDAITRIKEAVAKEIALSKRGCSFNEEVKNTMTHLDDLFTCKSRPS